MSIAGRIARRAAAGRLARLRALAAAPEQVQEEIFRRLLRMSRRTKFGEAHGLGSVRTYDDWCRAVPLRDYHGMAPWWDRARAGERNVAWPGRVRYYGISSGTTAGEKYLPVSASTIRGNRRGGFDSMVPFLAQGNPDLFDGKLLFLGGCTKLRREGPSWIGDNTGIMIRHIPRLMRLWHTPGPEISGIPDWEQKIRKAAETTRTEDVRMVSGVPSWIILFFESLLYIARDAGRSVSTVKEIWPSLSLFIHGGVSIEAYRERLSRLVGGDLWLTDTYSATEGGMLAVQDDPADPGMLPLVDQGVFFEFVPADEIDSDSPTRLRLREVEAGPSYAVVLTTDSGIYSYLVGDLVSFTDTSPCRLVFDGRIAHTLNAFGEHISGGELDRAVTAAARDLEVAVREYAAAPAFPDGKDRVGGHVFYIETEDAIPDAVGFSDALDRHISAGNEDYATHRTYGVSAPRVVPLPPGTFYAWMRGRGKIGGQNKIPRVLRRDEETSLVATISTLPTPGD